MSKDFPILGDDRDEIDDETIGGAVNRTVQIQPVQPQAGQINLQERRPWLGSSSAIATFRIAYDFQGKEVGLPRTARKQLRASNASDRRGGGPACAVFVY
jgi:hypothetical protein